MLSPDEHLTVYQPITLTSTPRAAIAPLIARQALMMTTFTNTDQHVTYAVKRVPRPKEQRLSPMPRSQHMTCRTRKL